MLMKLTAGRNLEKETYVVLKILNQSLNYCSHIIMIQIVVIHCRGIKYQFVFFQTSLFLIVMLNRQHFSLNSVLYNVILKFTICEKNFP